MKNQPGFFDFAAEVGLTKHIGGLEATGALIGLRQIGENSYVLDVGCSVDISARMVERSIERAR